MSIQNTQSIGIIVKINKNLNLNGYDVKKKIEEYFNGSTETQANGHSAFQPF